MIQPGHAVLDEQRHVVDDDGGVSVALVVFPGAFGDRRVHDGVELGCRLRIGEGDNSEPAAIESAVGMEDLLAELRHE